jgi:DNA-binding MarR family transcriptional regulator
VTDEAYDALEREFSLLLRRARANASELSREVHPDLDGSAYMLLSYVVQADGLRAGDLAALFGVDKGAISRQVTRLERAGLIERRPDPDDRRAQVLVATREGARRHAAAIAQRRARFRERLRDWPDADVATLARLLGRLNVTADGHPQPPGGADAE